ncbi:hypothetical protein [Butyricimonas paravirosa]|mgnify:CR=1 FL=1|uniref:hypothetical protein n=1 Tax=Butyricimonas paravirosa TaxID=1472417 RepID=UPI002A820FA5|nr:hypothetical protein [Butyricimonas paravirosa]
MLSKVGGVKFSKYLKLQFETNSDLVEWFGYYNYDTLDQSQTRMLCNRAEFEGVVPLKGMRIELGYYDISNGDWHRIGNSDSWNWQQGSMMQWIPGEGNENKVIYNCSKDNHLAAKICDVVTGEVKDLDWTIYGITPDGKKSITLEMERSRWCRAYHYKSVENLKQEGRIIDSDGIFELDLESNTRKRIISIQNIVNTDYRDYFNECKHWLEHIMINPSGTRFCFLHRFSPVNNVYKYQTRLCIANIDGSNLQIIDGWEKYRWSHFGWKSDSEFVIYTVHTGKIVSSYSKLGAINEIQTPSINQKCGMFFFKCIKLLPKSIRKKFKGRINYYQYYKLIDGKFSLVENWKKSFFDIDGHPSFTKDGRYMITDSYPDRKQYQRLIVFDSQTKKGLVLGKAFAALMNNPASCDLHPKLCLNNDFIVIDSAYDGKHHMLMFSLDWDKIKKKIS